MTDSEILEALKTGLQMSSTAFDGVLLQKGRAVEGYMLNAGVTAAGISSNLGIACLCVGVTDLWNLGSGEIKFSPVFSMLVEQLYTVGLG